MCGNGGVDVPPTCNWVVTAKVPSRGGTRNANSPELALGSALELLEASGWAE